MFLFPSFLATGVLRFQIRVCAPPKNINTNDVYESKAM